MAYRIAEEEERKALRAEMERMLQIVDELERLNEKIRALGELVTPLPFDAEHKR
jgi:hypothetical protein